MPLKSFSQECESDYSAIILDNKSKRIIYELRAKKIIYPASLTKIMTLYLIFEALENNKFGVDDEIKVSDYVQDISHINSITTLDLKKGETLSVRKAIRATAVKSMNGAALALAEYYAGNEWKFAKKMNEKAKELDMKNSNFRNSTGLHEYGQYSTAYDLARLMVKMQEDFSEYMGVFARKEIEFRGNIYNSHNHFLLEYEDATGFKTGFTSISGFNLMATAKRDNRTLSGVIVGCEAYEKRDEMMKNLFDLAFEIVKSEEFQDEIEVRL